VVVVVTGIVVVVAVTGKHVCGILNSTRSKDDALLLWSELYELRSVSSNFTVFVIVSVWVIEFVQAVVITLSCIFSTKDVKSRLKMNLVNPSGATLSTTDPKYKSITGFLPVFVKDSEIRVLFLLKYDLCVDIELF